MLTADPRTSRWGSARRRAAVGAAVIAVAAGAVAIALSVGTSSSRYRTVVARPASVMKMVAVTGTVEPVNRVTLTFGVQGTVASVKVHVGQHVRAGQTLATLATTSLTQQVTQAEAALRVAQATVAADEKGQAAATTDPSGQGGTSGAVPGNTPTGGSTTGAPTTLNAAQQAVVAAQKKADAAEQAAASALSAADTACGTTGTGTHKSSTSTTTTTTTTTPSHGSGSGGTGGTACAVALHDALAAQQGLAADQHAVTTAETALAKLLAEGGSHTAAPTPSRTSPPSSTPTTPSTSGSTGLGAALPSTPKGQAAQLASDQATVDTDDAKLLVAQQSLAEADLTAPITGTVGAVNISKGAATSTDSSTAAITILTQHTFEAEGLVSPTQVPTLAVGDRVTVTVDGRSSPITGTVTRIGPVDTTIGYQYPVVVALPPGIPRLFTGSLCQMTVVVRVAERTLAVPTSAVHTTHRHSYVTVLRGGRTHRQSVAIGIVGTDETQVLSGLRAGEDVVLATLARPLPKPASSVARHHSSVPLPFPGPGTHIFFTGNGAKGVFYSNSVTA